MYRSKEENILEYVSFNLHASKIMLKILQARLQQYMNFQMYKLGLEKAEETRDQIANIHWIMEKAREFQKIIFLIGG